MNRADNAGDDAHVVAKGDVDEVGGRYLRVVSAGTFIDDP